MRPKFEKYEYEPTPTFDRPPAGWFVLDVMQTDADPYKWVALIISAPRGSWPRRECWVPIPGSHASFEAASDALEAMTATRH